MKYKVCLMLLFSLFFSFIYGQTTRQWGNWTTWGEFQDSLYQNPIIPSDYSDIDCIRVGDDYYAISSTFQFSPGMTILHSKDLVNWRICGQAVADLTQIGPELSWKRMNRYARGIWAGTIRYHQGRFYIFFGTPFMCCSFVLNNLLRSEGKPVFATIAIGFGGLLNIALDPLFIFTFKLGISGAAIATLISQCFSFSILLYFFVSGKSITKLSIRHVATHMGVYLQILSIGFPSFCRQGLASISTVALNIAAANYGDAAVAAMSIVGRIFFLVLAILIGFGHGFQPVVGYNYGAKRYGRVHEAFFFCVKAGTVFLACAGIAGFIFAPEILGLFRKEDAAVLAIGTAALRAQCAALPFQPLSVLSNMLFQSVGKPVQATFVAATRQGIYFIPLIIILPCFFGLRGVELTQCISDFLSFLSCIPLLILFFRDLRRREMQEGSCETH